MPSDPPAVSVVLVCWNSAATLPRCLHGLASQTRQDFEVIIVDNGSSDGAAAGIEAKYPALDIQVKRLQANMGFSLANNVGARLARGHWLALLNTDAFPAIDWMEQLLQAAQRQPAYSSFASRQTQANSPELLDGAGDSYHISGIAWQRYHDYPAARFAGEQMEVFSACGAAALYSREAFLSVGGFDEDFFSYHEDVDIGFRLRLLGHRCLYVPQANVLHVGSASTGHQSDFVLYHGFRNYVWSFVKNMPAGLLWRALPLHLMVNIGNLINYARRGRGRVVLRSKLDALKGLPRMIRKRRLIQEQRRISNAELLAAMELYWLQPYTIKYAAQRARKEYFSPPVKGPSAR